ncbi:MAG: hypothetical protein PUC50_09725 [Bacteroidales bacterium]|nr:hypothetical protein [Bacteroidales bacterium]
MIGAIYDNRKWIIMQKNILKHLTHLIMVELFRNNIHTHRTDLIFIVGFAFFLNFFAFTMLFNIIFPKPSTPIDVIVNDLATVFKQNRFKYVKTINVIKQIDDSCAIDFKGSISQKQLPYRMYYQHNTGRLEPINYKYPSFADKMDKLWRDIPLGGSFNQQFVRLGIYGNRTGADLLYTTIPKEEFISHFVDSMEYCVYPDIPKSQEHWIVKLEDNWYLYDGYFRMDIE